jgi:hypothetical protein
MRSTALPLRFAAVRSFGPLHFKKRGQSMPLKKDGRYLKRCLLFHVSARNPVATNTFEECVAHQHDLQTKWNSKFEATDSVTQL